MEGAVFLTNKTIGKKLHGVKVLEGGKQIKFIIDFKLSFLVHYYLLSREMIEFIKVIFGSLSCNVLILIFLLIQK